MNVSGNLENILIELFFSWLLTEFEASKLLFCNAKLRCQGHISLVDAAVDTALKRMQEATMLRCQIGRCGEGRLELGLFFRMRYCPR